jgi:hypothetical protein
MKHKHPQAIPPSVENRSEGIPPHQYPRQSGGVQSTTHYFNGEDVRCSTFLYFSVHLTITPAV